jgi:hypothetical protein
MIRKRRVRIAGVRRWWWNPIVRIALVRNLRCVFGRFLLATNLSPTVRRCGCGCTLYCVSGPRSGIAVGAVEKERDISELMLRRVRLRTAASLRMDFLLLQAAGTRKRLTRDVQPFRDIETG